MSRVTPERTDRPTTISYRGGRSVQSYSVLDRGYDPFDYFGDDLNVIRVILGDINFMGRFSRDGKLVDLLIIPEHPSGHFSELRSIMTFYGIIINRFVERPIIEVRAWDNTFQYIDWHYAISLLSGVDMRSLSELQNSVIAEAIKLDNFCRDRRPNHTADEMRSLVGSPPGARISIMPLVFSQA